jgi:hypothetical protein
MLEMNAIVNGMPSGYLKDYVLVVGSMLQDKLDFEILS